MADKGTVRMASTASSDTQQSFFNRWESKNSQKALYNRTFCCPRDIILLFHWQAFSHPIIEVIEPKLLADEK